MSYPSTLDSFTNGIVGNPLNNPSMTTIANAANTALLALETKLGVDSSAVTTTIDYLLKNTASIDPGHKHSTASISGIIAIAQGGTGQATKVPAFDALQPMTTAGDTVYGGTAGTGTRLAKGTATQVLHSGTTPTWSAVDLTADITGNLPVTNQNSGTGASSSTFWRGDGTWASPTGVFKNGTATRNAQTASGSQTIAHGVGATPKNVRINAFYNVGNAASFGVYNGTTSSNVYYSLAEGGQGPTSNMITIYGTTGVIIQSATIAVDATNITLTWTATNPGSFANINIDLLWEANT